MNLSGYKYKFSFISKFYDSHNMAICLRVLLSSTLHLVQHIGSTQKGHSFSAPKYLSSKPKNAQFSTKNSSVQQPPQFNTKGRKKSSILASFTVFSLKVLYEMPMLKKKRSSITEKHKYIVCMNKFLVSYISSSLVA